MTPHRLRASLASCLIVATRMLVGGAAAVTDRPAD